ncbi:MAG: PKD domain-containing protein [Methanospirillaceae archaeon]|nr:PKD domain-containing protein [Methanospirillaceae archaeon]
MKRRIVISGFVIIFLTGILGSGSVITDQQNSTLPIQGTVIQLTDGNHLRSNPVIGDRYIVWEDYCNDIRGRDWERNTDLYGYDWIWNKAITPIKRPSRQTEPVISGSSVVWQDNSRTNWDIRMSDIKTGYDLDICRLYGDQMNPDTSEWTVVWQDKRDYTTDIYGYDLVRLKEFPVCIDIGEQTEPQISGTRVIWSDDRNGNPDIYGYDIETMIEFPVCRDLTAQLHPDISGDIVVWEDYRSGKSQIYSHDLTTGEEKAVSPSGGGQYNPKIHGNRIVFEDDRDGDKDIYLFDLKENRLYQVTCSSAEEVTPDIFGDRIVWVGEHKTAIPSSDVFLLVLDFMYQKADIYQEEMIRSTGCCSDTTLSAAFVSDTRKGPVPANISFTDISCGQPDQWIWRFGDGGFSIDQNPTYVYQNPGSYTVSFTAVTGNTSDTVVIPDYIIVTEKAAIPACGNITIHKGWNLISPPRSPAEGFDTMQVFSGVGSDGHSLFGYDAGNATWTRLTPADRLSPYHAFFIFSGEKTDVGICYRETETDETREFFPGWNLVGFSQKIDSDAEDSLSAGVKLPPGWLYCIGFNATEQRYNEISTPDTGILPKPDPASGYWIWIDAV